MQPHKTRAGGGGHIAPPVGTPPAWYFLPSAAESTQRTPPKPMVLESLRGRGAVRNETHLPRESNSESPRRAFVSSLRLSPCKSACALALTCRNYNLHCTPCPFVGGGVPTPRLYALLVTFRRGRCLHRPAWICTALLATCHCETSAHAVHGNPRPPSLGSPAQGELSATRLTEGS